MKNKEAKSLVAVHTHTHTIQFYKINNKIKNSIRNKNSK